MFKANDHNDAPAKGTLLPEVADLLVAAYERRLAPGSLSKLDAQVAAAQGGSDDDDLLCASPGARLSGLAGLCAARCAQRRALPARLDAVLATACAPPPLSPEAWAAPDAAANQFDLLKDLVALFGSAYHTLPSLRRAVAAALAAAPCSSKHAWSLVNKVRQSPLLSVSLHGDLSFFVVFIPFVYPPRSL